MSRRGSLAIPAGLLLAIGVAACSGSGDEDGGDPCPAPGTWTAAGTLVDYRESSGAVLLEDGRVLVAGGHPDFSWNYIGTSEIWDPATGVWTTAGSLVYARGGIQKLVRLSGGDVLLAGEYPEPGGPATGAEIFDVTTGTWSTTGSLAFARTGPESALLDDGRVLVAGGIDYDIDDIHAEAEVFDPALGTWTTVGSMAQARFKAGEAVLAGGRVLLAGGTFQEPSAGSPLSSAELFDPATNSWEPAGTLSVARENPTAVRLLDGRVLLVGGEAGSFGNYQVLNDVEIFDPADGTWSVAASMEVERGTTQIALLADGRVLATGGGSPSGGVVYRSAEIYDPVEDRWCSAGDMTKARRLHRAVSLPDGRVLVVGGYNGAMLRDAEIYTPPPAD